MPCRLVYVQSTAVDSQLLVVFFFGGGAWNFRSWALAIKQIPGVCFWRWHWLLVPPSFCASCALWGSRLLSYSIAGVMLCPVSGTEQPQMEPPETVRPEKPLLLWVYVLRYLVTIMGWVTWTSVTRLSIRAFCFSWGEIGIEIRYVF